MWSRPAWRGAAAALLWRRIASATRHSLRAELEALYEEHNPSKLADVDALAAKYGEAKLLAMARKKYGLPPPSAAAPPDGAGEPPPVKVRDLRVTRRPAALTTFERFGVEKSSPSCLVGITEGDRRQMSVGTVREKLHAMATALGARQYVEPTNGRRVWTAGALQAAASACGCRGGAAAPSAASSAAPCPFCSPADDDDAMRHAGDARAVQEWIRKRTAGGRAGPGPGWRRRRIPGHRPWARPGRCG